SSAEVQSYVQYLQQSQNEVMATIGVAAENKIHSYTYVLNGFAARMTPKQAEAAAMQPGVLMVMRDQFRQPLDDDVPAFLGLTEPDGAWARRYTGESVIVGVVDTGIWPEHPRFADNGTYRPLPGISVPCQFGNTAHNPADAPFQCNNKLLGARQSLATYKQF